MQIFVGFFGLNRSLEFTFDSIEQNALAPFRALGVVTAAAHFNRPAVIDNPRSAERGLVPNMRNVDRLNLDICFSEQQDDHNVADLIEITKDGRDILNDPSGRSRINILHQQRSLGRLWDLSVMLERKPFDLYVFLRPDLRYLEPLPAEHILEAVVKREVDFISPSWLQCGGYNDRFSFCSRRGAFCYTHRLQHVGDFFKKHGFLQSEIHLKYCVDRADLKCEFVDARAGRVRSAGWMNDEAFDAK